MRGTLPKTQKYSKEFLCKVTNEIRQELLESKKKVNALKSSIMEEKKILNNTGESHDRLWEFRWRLKVEEDRIIYLKNHVRYFYKIMNAHYNPHNMQHLG